MNIEVAAVASVESGSMQSPQVTMRPFATANRLYRDIYRDIVSFICHAYDSVENMKSVF